MFSKIWPVTKGLNAKKAGGQRAPYPGTPTPRVCAEKEFLVVHSRSRVPAAGGLANQTNQRCDANRIRYERLSAGALPRHAARNSRTIGLAAALRCAGGKNLRGAVT